MHVSPDGKSLIPDPIDECRWQARDIIKQWLEANPGKLIVGNNEQDTLAQRMGWAIWEAKGKPTLPLFVPPSQDVA